MHIRTDFLFAAAATLLTFVSLSSVQGATADTNSFSVRIQVNAKEGRRDISPYLYGVTVASRVTPENGGAERSKEVQRIKDAGARISREAWGNNCTKFNWKLMKTSHPNWYNNVYEDNWDAGAQWIQHNFTDLDAIFALPVLGWVARTDSFNYNVDKLDPGHKHSEENLCGGGDPAKYLMKIDPSYGVGLFDHWFGKGGMGYDRNRFPIWQLDNEPEGWYTTHDDIFPKTMTAQEAVQKYLDVAKEAKRRYPDIKLMGPESMEEWSWWNWNNEFVDGLPWMEYFIKRFAEESKAFGRPLIDIISYHAYVGCPKHRPDDADVLQQHRIWFDTTYDFPCANGVSKYERQKGGNPMREMMFVRVRAWLDRYFGPGNNIGLAITESDGGGSVPPVRALWYASMLGTFSDNGATVFTPWYWSEPMWEVLHLFARYAGPVRVASQSSNEEMVSAYSSIDKKEKALTVLLVNRHPSKSASVNCSIKDFTINDGQRDALALSGLTDKRTFESHTKNALRKKAVPVKNGAFAIDLPPYSITAVLLDTPAN